MGGTYDCGKKGVGLGRFVPDKGKTRGSFLKKRTKKLLFIESTRADKHPTKNSKVFCFFFSKKKCFLDWRLLGNVPFIASPGSGTTASRLG
jgi:hypothetical protein